MSFYVTAWKSSLILEKLDAKATLNLKTAKLLAQRRCFSFTPVMRFDKHQVHLILHCQQSSISVFYTLDLRLYLGRQ